MQTSLIEKDEATNVILEEAEINVDLIIEDLKDIASERSVVAMAHDATIPDR